MKWVLALLLCVVAVGVASAAPDAAGPSAPAGTPPPTTTVSASVYDAVLDGYVTVTTTYAVDTPQEIVDAALAKWRRTYLDLSIQMRREAADAGIDYAKAKAKYDSTHPGH